VAVNPKIVQRTVQFFSGRELAAKGDDLGHDPIVCFRLKFFKIITEAFDDNAEKRPSGDTIETGVLGNGGHFTQQIDIILYIVTIFQVRIHKGMRNLP
jgi:hypothetical protein